MEIKITQLIIFYGLPSPTAVETLTTVATVPTTTTLITSTGSTVETLTTVATVPTTTTLIASTSSTVSTIATVASTTKSATNSACNPSATSKSFSLINVVIYISWAFRKSVPKIANPQVFLDLQNLRKCGNLRICDLKTIYFLATCGFSICGPNYFCELKTSANLHIHNFSHYKYKIKILSFKLKDGF